MNARVILAGLVIGLPCVRPAPGQPADATPARAASEAWAEQSEHAASRVWSGWLHNGVRVHSLAMGRPGGFSLTITLLGGTLTETDEDRGVTEAATLAWSQPATASMSSAKVREHLAANRLTLRSACGADAIQLVLSAPNEQAEAAFALAHALLTQPRVEPDAFEAWRTRALAVLARADSTPHGAFPGVMAAAISPPGEARTRPPGAAHLRSLTAHAAQDRILALVRESPAEVCVMGDLARDRALALAAAYLGTIPARERVAPRMFADLRTISRPRGPIDAERVINSTSPAAMVMSGFFGPDRDQRDDVAAIEVAARIVRERVSATLRRESLAAMVSTASMPGTAFFGYGQFGSVAPAAPERASLAARRIREVLEAFGRDGPAPGEFEPARDQAADQSRNTLANVDFWGATLETLTYDGTDLDEVLRRPEIIGRLTPGAMMDVYRRYCVPENYLSVIVRPSDPEPVPDRPAVPVGH